MYYLGLALIGIIGFILGKKLAQFRASQKTPAQTFVDLPKAELDNLQDKAQAAFDERTEERKQQILEFLKRETAHQQALQNCNLEDKPTGITREDVEKLLDVSDSTALRYLNQLEQENKITQSTPFGSNVRYLLNN